VADPNRWKAVPTHWKASPTRWKAVRIRPDCRCSSPTRLNRPSWIGHSMVRSTYFSMGSGRIRHLIGRFRTAQPHRTADSIGYGTPTVGLGPLHRCFAGRHYFLAGRHRAPSSLFRPAWVRLPDPGNRRCHAGAENQTEFEGS
jgi:hypothetical protein